MVAEGVCKLPVKFPYNGLPNRSTESTFICRHIPGDCPELATLKITPSFGLKTRIEFLVTVCLFLSFSEHDVCRFLVSRASRLRSVSFPILRRPCINRVNAYQNFVRKP